MPFEHGTRTPWNTDAVGCGDTTCLICYPHAETDD